MSRCPSRLAASLGSLVLMVAVGSVTAGGAGLNSDSKVKVSVKTEAAADKSETITITMSIDKGWHLYANPVGNAELADSQTQVTVDAKSKPEVLKIEYPAGKLVKDSVLGDYKVYEDQATIKVQLRRAEAGPITMAVKLQACSDKACLQPATVKTTLP